MNPIEEGKDEGEEEMDSEKEKHCDPQQDDWVPKDWKWDPNGWLWDWETALRRPDTPAQLRSAFTPRSLVKREEAKPGLGSRRIASRLRNKLFTQNS